MPKFSTNYPVVISALLFFIIPNINLAQCTLTANTPTDTIVCGDCIELSAFGQGQGVSIFNEDFNSGGFSTGWGSTPGAVNFTNPCSSNGVDGTTHAWMDNNTSVPRTLQSANYNLSSGTSGVTICFDMLFAEQGNAAPCEGPDEPDEGVYLQYSIDGGNTWVNIHYFDPNGGYDQSLINWNNWCFQLPPAAITPNTIIRWFQDNDSGADYDHWGIDNVNIYFNDPNYNITWLHDNFSYGTGNSGGINPNLVCPLATTTYNVNMTNGVSNCSASVTVNVKNPTFRINASPDTFICTGACVTLSGEATVIVSEGGLKRFENNQPSIVTSGLASVGINVQNLNATSIPANAIQEVCINNFSFSGSQICTNFMGCNCNGTNISFGSTCNLDISSFQVNLITPDNCRIELVPVGAASGTAYSNVCFVPSGGANINGGNFPGPGQWSPNQNFNNLSGCQANGVWQIEFDAGAGLGFGLGSLMGWSILFDDPEISYPANFTWSPTTNMTNSNTLTPTVCPPTAGNYTYTLQATDNAGCTNESRSVTFSVGCLMDNDLLNFNGLPKSNYNLLHWSTSYNSKIEKFEIQTSPNGFSDISTKGEITPTNTQSEFIFKDFNPLAKSYYRLKNTTEWGEIEFSNWIFIDNSNINIQSLKITKNNNDIIEISCYSEQNYTTEIYIFDVLGKLILNQKKKLTTGNNSIKINFSNYTQGIYIIGLKNKDHMLVKKFYND
ncbi:MAG: T9SS type A sorting domain-containing protein [Saprospiraceae bacterium]|nr:T9SS type A sorting domain-containing protein [Saprospiraceae bacterium]